MKAQYPATLAAVIERSLSGGPGKLGVNGGDPLAVPLSLIIYQA